MNAPTSYDLTEVVAADELGALPPGSNLLVRGPSMVGKRALALELLSADLGPEDAIVSISTRDGAASIVEEIRSHDVEADPRRIGVVDCTGGRSGSPDRTTVERVSSPGDLTGVSVGTAKLQKRLARSRDGHVRYGLFSISTLLQYLDQATVFKFLHLYTRRVADTDGIGVFTIDEDAHDSQTINTLLGEFDGVVLLRETDAGDVEFQVRGFGRPTEWQSLD